jgi:protein-tyrosine phosphatase
MFVMGGGLVRDARLLGLLGGCRDNALEALIVSTGRHIPFDGQPNFRDLGGYETVDGRTVRYGQVYRSGTLAALSDADVSLLGELHVRTVVNLLTDDDREKYGEDRLPEGVGSVLLPIDSAEATKLANRANAALHSGDFALLPPGLNRDIHRLLIHDGANRYRRLLEIAAQPEQRALVFHCSHGVHRTGTGAAILLRLLGVPWETVRGDYLLSNTYRREEVRHQLEQLRMLGAQSQGVPAEEVDMTNAEAFMRQDGSYIDASRDEIVSQFGSFERYADEMLGYDASAISDLRASLLE